MSHLTKSMSFTETKKNHNSMSTINAIKLNNSLFINQHNKLKLKIVLKEKKMFKFEVKVMMNRNMRSIDHDFEPLKIKPLKTAREGGRLKVPVINKNLLKETFYNDLRTYDIPNLIRLLKLLLEKLQEDNNM